jgi:hypothetical protein
MYFKVTNTSEKNLILKSLQGKQINLTAGDDETLHINDFKAYKKSIDNFKHYLMVDKVEEDSEPQPSEPANTPDAPESSEPEVHAHTKEEMIEGDEPLEKDEEVVELVEKTEEVAEEVVAPAKKKTTKKNKKRRSKK